MKEINKQRILSRRKSLKLLGGISSGILITGFNPLKMVQTIHQKTIPSSGEKLPVIGLGTWQTFDVGSSSAEREPLKDVLKIMVDHGGSVIDSSPMYGRSERVVGDLTSELGIRDKLFMATKVWTSGKQSGINQMERSFSLMNVRKMDLMQIHNLLDWKTHSRTLRNWKEQDKIRYWGITHYTSGAYGRMMQIMKSEKPDFIQINYSLRERASDDRLLPLAKDLGIAVIINRPYSGGFLFRITRNKEIPGWAKEYDINSWGQFFLKFVVSHPAVTCAIPGTSKPHHMSDNMQAGFGAMPDPSAREKMISFVKSL